MRAIVLGSYGGVDVLQIAEVPDPTPGPEDVLVEVVGTALNRADLLQRRGLYPGPAAEHEIPGLEFAGRVAEVGRAADGWAVGDEVMGIVAGGAYAQRLAVHGRQLMPVPVGVDLADAAAIPEVFMTAFDALVVQGGLTSGRWALVHAGASGVGTASIQIAKAIGAKIVVTASAAKHDRCRELGADLVVDYKTESFSSVVSEATRGQGVDVVLDVVGGEYTVDNLKSLKVGGRIIQVGVMGQSKVELPLGLMLAKRASLIGTVLRSRPVEEKIALTQQVIAELLPRFDDGSLGPVIDSRYRLDQIAEAHTYMETNANVGKIMIDIEQL